MIAVELDQKNFEPGSFINGTVRWSHLRPAESLDIRLIWYTSGKGDQDFGIHSRIAIGEPGESGERAFAIPAPAWPHSFSGILISLTWAVEVVRLPGLDAERCDIVIAPGGRELSLHSGQNDTSNS